MSLRIRQQGEEWIVEIEGEVWFYRVEPPVPSDQRFVPHIVETYECLHRYLLRHGVSFTVRPETPGEPVVLGDWFSVRIDGRLTFRNYASFEEGLLELLHFKLLKGRREVMGEQKWKPGTVLFG